jgi:hypothetical protein
LKDVHERQAQGQGQHHIGAKARKVVQDAIKAVKDMKSKYLKVLVSSFQI